MILPDCTIVIPTRNRARDLQVTAQRLIELELADTPIVVVDDASDDPDASRAAIARLRQVRFVPLEKRSGTAEARNVGLQTATTDYCFFLDDDSHPEEAKALYTFLSSVQDGGTAVWRFETIREYDGDRAGLPENMPRAELATFIGFGVLMNRSAVLGVGGYRACFRYRCEEDDLAVRLFRAGLHIRYEPGIRVIHRHTTEARCSTEYDFLSARNVFLLYAYNWPLPVGPLLGLAKSASVIVKTRNHIAVRLQGVASGVATFLRHWHDRTPLSWRQVASYRKLRRRVEVLKSL